MTVTTDTFTARLLCAQGISLVAPELDDICTYITGATSSPAQLGLITAHASLARPAAVMLFDDNEDRNHHDGGAFGIEHTSGCFTPSHLLP